MAIVGLRINIDPYYDKVADYYWDERPLEGPHLTIWEWLYRDYGVIKLGALGSKQGTWITFPDEEHRTLFLLRWA